MIRCVICGKEDYVDGNAECSQCARLRGHDDLTLKRRIVELEVQNDLRRKKHSGKNNQNLL